MQSKGVLSTQLECGFSEALETLRRDGWDPRPSGCARDEFDECSQHVVVSLDERPVGAIRITPAEPSVLAKWSHGRAPVPSGGDVAELTRGVVVPRLRRIGIYRFAMLETVLRLRQLGARIATAAVEPEFPGRAFLADLGFVDVGQPILFDDAPRRGTLAQCIALEGSLAAEARWARMCARQIERFSRQGFEVRAPVSSAR